MAPEKRLIVRAARHSSWFLQSLGPPDHRGVSGLSPLGRCQGAGVRTPRPPCLGAAVYIQGWLRGGCEGRFPGCAAKSSQLLISLCLSGGRGPAWCWHSPCSFHGARLGMLQVQINAWRCLKSHTGAGSHAACPEQHALALRLELGSLPCATCTVLRARKASDPAAGGRGERTQGVAVSLVSCDCPQLLPTWSLLAPPAPVALGCSCRDAACCSGLLLGCGTSGVPPSRASRVSSTPPGAGVSGCCSPG